MVLTHRRGLASSNVPSTSMRRTPSGVANSWRRRVLPLSTIVGDLTPSFLVQAQLGASGVPFERWAALSGGPALLQTHAKYFGRGIERHLCALSLGSP